ncbi:hypothetical protein TA3x_001523 [Tundrisphaera sp. TA3]|uniref:hypothetical protein n=1 Tax=Tundrisphaera sp. TA3 TaxID=3435775 RepID=UPI003EBC5CFA
MTQTQDKPTLLIPAARRELPAVPVLIRVPMVAGVARGPRHRPRRRRLRREVRFAALALLTAFPVSLGLFLASGDRAEALAIAATTTLDIECDEPPIQCLSLRLEPIVSTAAPILDRDVPVVLPGYLLPAEVNEETSDGGH